MTLGQLGGREGGWTQYNVKKGEGLDSKFAAYLKQLALDGKYEFFFSDPTASSNFSMNDPCSSKGFTITEWQDSWGTRKNVARYDETGVLIPRPQGNMPNPMNAGKKRR